MNLTIPYRNDNKDGHELRFAIRSMEKHFLSMTGCIVIGDKPTWYTGEHIPAQDIPDRKEYSVYCKLKLVNGTILYSMDDVYALQPFSRSLPNYYFGTCREMAMRVKDRRFKDLFGTCLPEWKSFEVHCPMVIDTTKLDWDDENRLLKTTYANRCPGNEVEQIDCKLRDDFNYGEVKNLIKGKPFWSTHDNGERPGILSMLNKLYPNKSKYEC